MSHGTTRRKLLGSTAGFAVAATFNSALAARLATPWQTEGPFYPRPQDMPADRDNDLIRDVARLGKLGGKVLHLRGRVVGGDAAPVPDVTVEIWQCDVQGRYLHRGDWSSTRRIDKAFQGFGKTTTDADGNYYFRTIRPTPYPGRTPHIHFKLRNASGEELLTTQMYVAGDKGNRRDGLYNRLSKAERRAASVSVENSGKGELKAFFEIVI